MKRRSLGKTAHVLENPQFTEKFRPWLGKLTCETLPSSACVVSVDIAAENLLPFDLPDCAIEGRSFPVRPSVGVINIAN